MIVRPTLSAPSPVRSTPATSKPRLTRGRWLLAMLALVVMGGLTLLAGAALGPGDAGLSTLLLGGAQPTAAQHAILWSVRVPRVLVGAVVGGGLSVAGVVFQALLRNPLAEPYVLGVSGGASLGGILALVLGLASGPGAAFAVPGLAFLGAMVSLFTIERLATIDGQLSVYTVLLTGTIFNAFSGAVIFFVQSMSSLEQLHAIVFYLMGSLSSLEYPTIAALASVVVVTTVLLMRMGRDYNLLSLGEQSAQQLGVPVERVKRTSLILASLLTGLCVSVAGLIGFVGLVVPHVLRLLMGPDHRLLIPASLLGGASFLVVADTVARLIVSPAELPVGVVTALVGGPFFLFMLRRGGSRGRYG